MSAPAPQIQRKKSTFDVRFTGFDPSIFDFIRDVHFPGVITKGGMPGHYTCFQSAIYPCSIVVNRCTTDMMLAAFESFPGIKMEFVKQLTINGNN
jgi:predicted metal-binding transcription factor (methanogenesis marker protein 9)